MRVSHQIGFDVLHRRRTGVPVVCGAFFLALLVVLAPAVYASDGSDEALGQDGDVYEQLSKPQDILKYYPSVRVKERIPVLSEGDYYPCSDCHNEDQPANPTIRELSEEHDTLNLRHGKGQFWCLTCHDAEDRDSLTSLKAKTISFNESFLLCGQCHSQRQKDFFYGGHGKRVGSWQGEKELTPCTECHDPHSPSIKPRKPFRPPNVRKGLEANKATMHHPESSVGRIAERHGAPTSHHGSPAPLTHSTQPAPGAAPDAHE